MKNIRFIAEKIGVSEDIIIAAFNELKDLKKPIGQFSPYKEEIDKLVNNANWGAEKGGFHWIQAKQLLDEKNIASDVQETKYLSKRIRDIDKKFQRKSNGKTLLYFPK